MPPSDPSPAQSAGSTACLRAMVIDDVKAVRLFHAGLLAHMGFDVRYVASGNEGIQALRAQPADVVVLDLHMEGLSGEETLRAIQSDPTISKAAVLIVSTERTCPLVCHANSQHGPVGFVAKPLLPVILHEKLTELLNERMTSIPPTGNGFPV